MRNIILFFLALLFISIDASACTNFLITKGASIDGSTMITYAADSHGLYGELYFRPSQDYSEGSMVDIYEWDTGERLGEIKQVLHTYSVVGNMNEHQLAIAETTFDGREELQNTEGIIDYGSLIYLTLQRAKSAREAIKVMADLVYEYGYYSTGESFSIADPNEVWIMEMIGKGKGNKGAIWVAQKIPDGYISGHANHARITTFPQADGKTSITSMQWENLNSKKLECIYENDVVSFAINKKYFEGSPKDFSFSDTYAPISFGAARLCEARVWAGFNRVNDEMSKYLDYAKGENLGNRMPLWIKPENKLSVHDVMELMRDYYQGTELDMSADIGAGPYGNIVRWRPLIWEVDSVKYFNERAISTQQTAFSFVAQCRNWLPDPIGGILWFGVDDTYMTVYSPMYCGIKKVPFAFAEGNGKIMEFTDNSAFWIFNQVSNFAYSRFNIMIDDIKKLQLKLEQKYLTYTSVIDKAALELYTQDKELGIQFITDYSVSQGNNTFSEWKQLYRFLFAKYVDGNVKEKDGDKLNPKIEQPGYPDEWYKKIREETGGKFEMKGVFDH